MTDVTVEVEAVGLSGPKEIVVAIDCVNYGDRMVMVEHASRIEQAVLDELKAIAREN